MTTPTWALVHFGAPGKKPQKQSLNATLRLWQLICSTTTMVLWVVKSYLLEMNAVTYAIEVLCCIVFIAHLMYALVNSGFDVNYVLG